MAFEPGSGLSAGEMLRDHARRIDELERFRDELRGAMSLVKFTLGASIVSGIASVLAIITVFAEKS